MNEKLVKIKKPVRTRSGVTPLTVVCKPYDCPHGRCTFCPGGVKSGTPQSYTKQSPAIMRASELSYDPYIQVQTRLRAFKNMGHPTSKVEVIYLGGTFLAYPIDYQYEFSKEVYNGLNGFRSASLEEAKKVNEKSKNRCVALCVETKPDWAFEEHIDRLLDIGCTRVELGVQIIDDEVYNLTNRGHTVADVIKSTQLLKDAGFKIGYHIMPGLPGSSLKKDMKLFMELFENQDFKPDQLKIYPLQIMKDTPLEVQYKNGEFQLYREEDLLNLVCKMKSVVPEYCRIMRVLRQFSPTTIRDGKIRTDIRVYLEKKMREMGLKCRCIRCREIGFVQKPITGKLELKILEYEASNGKEFFLSYERQDYLLGLCRARIPYKPHRKEITTKTLIVRELHVYGQQVSLEDNLKKESQHQGLGKKLMLRVEDIAKNNNCDKMVVISGVGVKQYYRERLNYKDDGPYVSKEI